MHRTHSVMYIKSEIQELNSTGAKELLISKGLKEYEEMLTPFNFIRVHHSHLINLRQILRFDKGDGGILIMANKDSVPVSQRKRESLLEILNQL